MTDIVTPPAVPEVSAFPAPEESGFNIKAYAYGVSQKALSDALPAIIGSAHTNAVAAQERAVAAEEAAGVAGSAASAAVAARDNVAAIVATLPDGAIIDGAPSSASAWSSQKTATEISAAVAAGVKEWPPIGGIAQLMSTAETLTLDERLFLRSGMVVHPDDVPDWPAWAVQPSNAFGALTSGFGSNDIRAIAQAGNVWMAGGAAGVLRRSTDTGGTWSTVTSGFSTSQINGLATDGAGTWVAVGAAGKVARSTDNGLTWAIVSAGFSASYAVTAVATNAAGVWIAVNENGELRRSTDNGASWAVVAAGFIAGTGLSCAAFGNGVFLAGGYDGAGVMRRSTDNGATWTATSGTLPLWMNALATDGTGVWMAGGRETGNLRRSTDNGANWVAVPTATWPGYVNGLCAMGDGVWFGVGNSGAVRSSTDNGLTWDSVTHGFGSANVYAVAQAQGFIAIAGGAAGAMQRSRSAIGLETYEQYKYLRIA